MEQLLFDWVQPRLENNILRKIQGIDLSLIHISEPTRLRRISYAVFTNAPQTVKGIVAAAISVFVWVILWDPMEQLLFDWVQPRLENNILRKIQGIDVVIRAKS